MSRKFKVWLDSGANIHSSREQIVSLDDIGCTDEEWDELSEDQREELMREVAFDQADWGFEELKATSPDGTPNNAI